MLTAMACRACNLRAVLLAAVCVVLAACFASAQASCTTCARQQEGVLRLRRAGDVQVRGVPWDALEARGSAHRRRAEQVQRVEDDALSEVEAFAVVLGTAASPELRLAVEDTIKAEGGHVYGYLPVNALECVGYLPEAAERLATANVTEGHVLCVAAMRAPHGATRSVRRDTRALAPADTCMTGLGCWSTWVA